MTVSWCLNHKRNHSKHLLPFIVINCFISIYDLPSLAEFLNFSFPEFIFPSFLVTPEFWFFNFKMVVKCFHFIHYWLILYRWRCRFRWYVIKKNQLFHLTFNFKINIRQWVIKIKKQPISSNGEVKVSFSILFLSIEEKWEKIELFSQKVKQMGIFFIYI